MRRWFEFWNGANVRMTTFLSNVQRFVPQSVHWKDALLCKLHSRWCERNSNGTLDLLVSWALTFYSTQNFVFGQPEHDLYSVWNSLDETGLAFDQRNQEKIMNKLHSLDD